MEHSTYAATVARPFEVYNSIFLTLPLDGIRGTGLRVPLFAEACRKGLMEGRSPMDLLSDHLCDDGVLHEDVVNLLFHYVQYIERQVVLVDDASERLPDVQRGHLAFTASRRARQRAAPR